MGKIELTVEEGIAYAEAKGYWEGYAAAAGVFAEHAKQLALREILSARQTNPQVTTEPEVASQKTANGRTRGTFQEIHACDCYQYANQVCDICQSGAANKQAVNGKAEHI